MHSGFSMKSYNCINVWEKVFFSLGVMVINCYLFEQVGTIALDHADERVLGLHLLQFPEVIFKRTLSLLQVMFFPTLTLFTIMNSKFPGG